MAANKKLKKQYEGHKCYTEEERAERTGWFMFPGVDAHFYVKGKVAPECTTTYAEVPYYQRPMWDYDHCQECRVKARECLKAAIERRRLADEN